MENLLILGFLEEVVLKVSVIIQFEEIFIIEVNWGTVLLLGVKQWFDISMYCKMVSKINLVSKL